MNYRMILRIIAHILWVEIVFMVPALLLALFHNDNNVVISYVQTIVITGVTSALFYIMGRSAKKGFYARDGLVTTGISWILISFFGCLPFYFSGAIPKFIDAYFEMVSGFTTTGSSILSDVEALPHSLLYWRSFSHWLGGMGVLVFLLAIIPLAGRNEGYTVHILRAESPGPSVGKLVPRMKKTALILYWLYIALTVLDFIFLLLGGMSTFEAICTAFGTAGTGGFGVRNDSLASYSPYIQNVTTVFMFLFGVNFSIYYCILLRRFKEIWMDDELRVYLGFIFVSILLITINITPMYDGVMTALRHAAFQVGTVMSTTGFATTDFDLWPSFSKTIMLILMLGGACAGSTGGGFKMARYVLLFKNLRRNIHESLHPTEIRKVRVNKQTVDEKILKNTNAYLVAYVGIMVVSLIIISLDGFSLETNLSAVIATLNNIGPGFNAVGPTCNYSQFSTLSKIVMIGNMLAGRLEIFPILVLFSRGTWRRK